MSKIIGHEDNINAIRALIKKHKKNDRIFSYIGLFVIGSLAIALLVLFLDLVIDGYPKMNLEFFDLALCGITGTALKKM